MRLTIRSPVNETGATKRPARSAASASRAVLRTTPTATSAATVCGGLIRQFRQDLDFNPAVWDLSDKRLVRVTVTRSLGRRAQVTTIRCYADDPGSALRGLMT
ncbi:hypothetical protein FAF44_21750 [Nonomuraea sp. MG754425]|uniref:hypothetical protein n=1 Tax=Nonomuraea sp. MG754425 TaxID=2570319 RepID=UPI001F3FDC8E|nr:hypothetical protein [Nonomuraea sp. MG754425]MCF6471001.1 hypothetical protein [Nonomuraea sp. MG754425]